MKNIKNQKGFTLIEILVVIGIIAVLAGIVLVAINPAKRFQDARNAQRRANLNQLATAIGQDMVDNKGVTTCNLPAAVGIIKSSPTAPDIDLTPCLSDYMASLPVDPNTGLWTDATSYNTKYSIKQDATTKLITICAPDSLTDPVQPEICVTR